MKGTVTSNGGRLHGDSFAGTDSEIGRRFKAAGLITFGKTNTPELGLNITTEPGAVHCRLGLRGWDLNPQPTEGWSAAATRQRRPLLGTVNPL